MQRLILAILAALVMVAITAFLIRSAARAVDQLGSNPAISTGRTMQKAAFFLLLCLIMYVSVSGGS